MRKRYLASLIIALSLLFIATIVVLADGYTEAPILAERVKKGELPPVEQRLPDEPNVITPLDSVGTYGGTLRRGITGPNDYNNYVRWMYDALVRYSQDGNTVVPKLIKSLTHSEDYTVWTINMLKGAKWSDGSSFTSADIMFWWNDYMLNEELNTSFPTWVKNSDGSLMEVSAPDDYTVVFKYKNPITTVPDELANMDNKDAQISMFLPSAYLKNFHAKYTDENKLNEMAKLESFDSWKQLFMNKELPFRNPDRPVMTPWVSVNTINDQIYVLKRNPYYVAVDTKGQQLPYIDEIDFVTYQDQTALNMAAIQGQLDMQDRHIVMSNYPVLMQQSKALGTYGVRLWTTFAGCDAVVAINTYCQNKELRDVIDDQQFRYALSIGIDRDEIIQSAFLGIGEARQGVPRKTSPYYPGDEWAYYGTNYDPDQANKILDKLGYDKKDSDGFRLNKQGNRITIEITWTPQFANWGDIANMVVQDWKKIGIEGIATERERTNMYTMADANELEAYIWNEDTAGFPFTGAPKFDPRNAWNTGDDFAIPVRDWMASNGEKGEKPTEDFARIMEIVDEAKTVGDDKKVELAHELFQIWSKGLYEIGIAGLTPMIQGVAVVNNNLKNVPQNDQLGNDWPLRTPGNARTEQFYFENAK